jgi:hypothetical protein
MREVRNATRGRKMRGTKSGRKRMYVCMKENVMQICTRVCRSRCMYRAPDGCVYGRRADGYRKTMYSTVAVIVSGVGGWEDDRAELGLSKVLFVDACGCIEGWMRGARDGGG